MTRIGFLYTRLTSSKKNDLLEELEKPCKDVEVKVYRTMAICSPDIACRVEPVDVLFRTFHLLFTQDY
jgi:hypothetical protein